MATNKELNEKIDKLTDMFNALMAIQAATAEGKVVGPKKRGRPSKNVGSYVEQASVADEVEVTVKKRRRGNQWENSFVDNGEDHVEDREIDKLLAVKPPIDKGVRKNPMVKSICNDCSKEEKVHRQFTFEGHHTCQKCLKNKVGK